MTIVDRLKLYKRELEIESQKEMATLLKISESFYSLIENGKKPVSKNVLRRLVILSGKPDEYWKYGITDEKEYLEKRGEFKSLKYAIDQLTSIGLLKDEDVDFNGNANFNDSVKEVLIAAMYSDVVHIIDKRKLLKDTKEKG